MVSFIRYSLVSTISLAALGCGSTVSQPAPENVKVFQEIRRAREVLDDRLVQLDFANDPVLASQPDERQAALRLIFDDLEPIVKGLEVRAQGTEVAAEASLLRGDLTRAINTARQGAKSPTALVAAIDPFKSRLLSLEEKTRRR